MSGPIMDRIHLWEKLRGLEGEEKDRAEMQERGKEEEEKEKISISMVGTTTTLWVRQI